MELWCRVRLRCITVVGRFLRIRGMYVALVAMVVTFRLLSALWRVMDPRPVFVVVNSRCRV